MAGRRLVIRGVRGNNLQIVIIMVEDVEARLKALNRRLQEQDKELYDIEQKLREKTARLLGLLDTLEKMGGGDAYGEKGIMG
jgi:septal ring factor EnvC (AmiA/AmiB activator)